jgi:hypothetical protein
LEVIALASLGCSARNSADLCCDDALDRGLDLAGDQLVLGLRRELRIRHLDRQYRDQALAAVVAGEFDLVLLQHAGLLDVLVDGARQCGAETGEMGAAILLRDVVGEAVDVFLVGIGPLHREIDGDLVGHPADADDARVQRGLELRQVLHEGADAALVLEYVAAFAAFVFQLDFQAGIEEGQLAQALGQDVVMELDIREDLGARLEAHLGAAAGGGAHLAQRIDRVAQRVFLFPQMAVALDGQFQLGAERVDDRDTDAVQTARDLVAVVVELAAGVQHGHHHFGGRPTLLRMHRHRDAAAIVGHGYRSVAVDHDLDRVAVTGERFVDRVVDHLEHHVVQAGAVVGIADVHAGALAHRIEALEDLDRVGVVGFVVRVAGGVLLGFVAHESRLGCLRRAPLEAWSASCEV